MFKLIIYSVVVSCLCLCANGLQAADDDGTVAAGTLPDPVGLAQTMAARLLYEQAKEHPQGERFLREVAVELGSGKISMDEAERLVALADRLGLLNLPASRPIVATPAAADTAPMASIDQPADPMERMKAILDGPQTQAEPAATSELPEVKPTVPRGTALPPMDAPRWRDAGPKGTVREFVEGKKPGTFYVLISSDQSEDFSVGQDFVVRDLDGDIVRGSVVKAQGKLVVGSLLAATWRNEDKSVESGTEVMVQRRDDLIER